ncbi:MAG: hypothetical protein ACR2PT_11250 [Endozoicomonas sp.]
MNNEFDCRHKLARNPSETTDMHSSTNLKQHSWRARWKSVDDSCQEEKWRREGKLR